MQNVKLEQTPTVNVGRKTQCMKYSEINSLN